MQSSVILDQQYQATIAIETDGEYWNLFRNRERALNYIADLIGCELVHSTCGVDALGCRCQVDCWEEYAGWLVSYGGAPADC